MKTPRHTAEIALIAERVGGRPWKYAEVRDIIPSSYVACLRGEGMIELVEAGEPMTWRLSAVALERYAPPMIIATNGERRPLLREDAAVLAVWQGCGRQSFRVSDFPSFRQMFPRLRVQGLVEHAATGRYSWQLTDAGEALGRDLAAQVAAASPSPQEASA